MANECVEIPISGLYRGAGGVKPFIEMPPEEVRRDDEFDDRLDYLEDEAKRIRNKLKKYDANGANTLGMRNLYRRAGTVGKNYHGIDKRAARADHGHGGNVGNTIYRRTAEWVIPGTLTTGDEQAGRPDLWGDGNFDSTLYTIDAVTAYVKTAPTGAAILIDINYVNPSTGASTSIFSTKLTIAAGAQRQTSSTNIFLASGATIPFLSDLTMDIDQVGSTVAGSDLSVKLHLKIATLALVLSGT